jgi:hypothetical protein
MGDLKEMANSLQQSPLPADLTGDEKDAYVIKLDEIASPLVSTHGELLRENIDRAKQLRRRNRWIELTLEEMQSLEPGVKLDF